MTGDAEQLAVGISLISGDCVAALPELDADSFDACVTDPPYHLTTDKRGGTGIASLNENSPAGRSRISTGFMGKRWDGGDVAFQVETWREVFRVLKPGAHLLACGGTRTYHRMACAIEDAGFEIRDCVQWLYGQGFAKSYNLNRNPICECINDEPSPKYDVHVVLEGNLSSSKYNGQEQSDVLLSRLSQQSISEHGTARAKSEIGGTKQSSLGRRIIHRAGQGLSDDTETRSSESEGEWIRAGAHISCGEDVGPTVGAERGSASHQPQPSGQSAGESTDLFEPSRTLDDRALSGRGACPRCGKLKKKFEGFGTALKPACELIVLARKPLSESTVAANVLKWGTGALNIDGCRVGIRERPKTTDPKHNGHEHNCYGAPSGGGNVLPAARWPANVIHDGSDEVVAAFPESAGQQGDLRGTEPSNCFSNVGSGPNGRHVFDKRGDSGSAARFFYTAKADNDDRLGSKHPTVKPLDLMQYLVRLVTPKGGLVLDCFAGTGTTGEAAFREGFRAVLIEREGEYQKDIRRRTKLLLAGSDERARATIKEKTKDKPIDAGPLFDWLAANSEAAE